MTTLLEHLKSHKVPPSTNMLPGLPIAPAVQAIVVDCVTIVDPQLAPIIRINAEMVMACLVDSHAACPAHSEVITSFETAPFLTCVAIVHIAAPASHVRFAAIQILAPTSLAKVESILHEETMAISGAVTTTYLFPVALPTPGRLYRSARTINVAIVLALVRRIV